MVDGWMRHGAALLDDTAHDPATVLATARTLSLIHGAAPGDAIRVNLADGTVAWCRSFSTGWSCVALAPLDSLHSVDVVPRDVFFAARWPRDWVTAREQRKAAARAADIPFTEGGMCWRTGNDGYVHVALIVCADPVALVLRKDAAPLPLAECGEGWRTLAYNVEGWRAEWDAGRHRFHNFRLGAMRAGLRMKHSAAKAARKATKDAQRHETPAERAARKAELSQRRVAAMAAGRARKKAERDAGLAAARAAGTAIRGAE